MKNYVQCWYQYVLQISAGTRVACIIRNTSDECKADTDVFIQSQGIPSDYQGQGVVTTYGLLSKEFVVNYIALAGLLADPENSVQFTADPDVAQNWNVDSLNDRNTWQTDINDKRQVAARKVAETVLNEPAKVPKSSGGKVTENLLIYMVQTAAWLKYRGFLLDARKVAVLVNNFVVGKIDAATAQSALDTILTHLVHQ